MASFECDAMVSRKTLSNKEIKVAFGKVEILIGFAKASYFSLSGRQHKEDHTQH